MRVLIVSKLFPPNTGAQGLQSGKVAEAIIDNGIEIAVVAGIDAGLRDSGLLNMNKDYLINYVPYAEPNSGRNILARAWDRFLSDVSAVNIYSEWVKNATSASKRIVRVFKPDIILSSSTPFDSHIIGLNLSRETKLPWVASFSDPWPAKVLPPPYNVPKPLLSLLHIRALREVLGQCNALHMPNIYGLRLTERNSRVRILHKSFAIPHISSANASSSTQKYSGWIGHIGTLDRERGVSRPLLSAIKEVKRMLADQFNGLVCGGTVCPEFRDLVRKMDMQGLVKIVKPVAPDEAVGIASSCTALLVIEADMPESPFLPSKFADYAATGRPIIAVTPPKSEMRDLLLKYGGGYAVSHNEEEIIGALKQIFSNKNEHSMHAALSCDCSLASVFSSRRVGGLYRRMFETLVGKDAAVLL